MYVCICVCMCVCIYVSMYVFMHACMYVSMYTMYVCKYICSYVCMYIMYVCNENGLALPTMVSSEIPSHSTMRVIQQQILQFS